MRLAKTVVQHAATHAIRHRTWKERQSQRISSPHHRSTLTLLIVQVYRCMLLDQQPVAEDSNFESLERSHQRHQREATARKNLGIIDPRRRS
jgi:hypothetical protein